MCLDVLANGIQRGHETTCQACKEWLILLPLEGGGVIGAAHESASLGAVLNAEVPGDNAGATGDMRADHRSGDHLVIEHNGKAQSFSRDEHQS